MHTIAKLCGLLIAAVLFWGCRKEGFTRLMDVEMKIKIVTDTERIKVGDTVKIIAWLPYKQYDRATNSTVDIRDMEVQSWGSVGYWALDSATNGIIHKPGGAYLGKIFFDVSNLWHI
jgi:cell wall assembly regulator SMI1